MLRQNLLKALCRQGQTVAGTFTSQSVGRSLYVSSKVTAGHISADHKKVSTPDDGDIGRGTHEPAPVQEGDSSDVVPNLVVPDDESGKVPNGVEEARGFKSRGGSSSTPELATQTTAKPGQEKKEVATSPTPGLSPAKMPPNKSIGSSWRPVSAFKQSRFVHTGGPGTGSSIL